jgi:hypothetical protein
MQNKILIGGAVAVVLYLVATRTCVGKKLVARVLGRELADCGCTDCGSHADPSTAQTASSGAASFVSTAVMLNLGGKDSGCDGCGGGGGLAGEQQTARTPVGLGIGRAPGERFELRQQPAPELVKEPPAQRSPIELTNKNARVSQPVPVPAPEQKTLALIGGNVGAGKGGR